MSQSMSMLRQLQYGHARVQSYLTCQYLS